MITYDASNHLYSKDLGSSVDRPDQSWRTDENYDRVLDPFSASWAIYQKASSHPFDLNPSHPPIMSL